MKDGNVTSLPDTVSRDSSVKCATYHTPNDTGKYHTIINYVIIYPFVNTHLINRETPGPISLFNAYLINKTILLGHDLLTTNF